MAGMGPAPAESRRRSNTPARGEWVDLPPLQAPVLPELPPRGDGEEWSQRAVSAWAAWRSDPVTAQWSPSDVSYALDAILLYDGMTASNANEVRLRMDGLGLTPKGKRDLRWRVGGAAEATKPKARRSAASSSRQARLSVVK